MICRKTHLSFLKRFKKDSNLTNARNDLKMTQIPDPFYNVVTTATSGSRFTTSVVKKFRRQDISPNFGAVIKSMAECPSNVLVGQDPTAINFAFCPSREEKGSTRSTNNNKITLRKNFYDAVPYLLSYTRAIIFL